MGEASLLQTKKINTGRQLEFDVAKTIAVLFMAIIHVFDNMAAVGNGTQNSLYQNFLRFLGAPMAAPMFMFALGVGIVYTRHSKPKEFAIRGLKLIAMGYALNFFRETLLMILANAFKVETVYEKALIDTIGTIDILQFAGITFLIVALFKKLKLTNWAMLLTTILLQGFGTLFIGCFDTAPKAVQYLLGLLFYTNEYVVFPALLWHVYPVAGICFGGVLQEVSDKKTFYTRIFIGSTVTLFASSITTLALGYDLKDYFIGAYFTQNLFSTIWILSIVGISVSAYFLISTVVKGKVAAFVKYVSTNLNTIYIAHWLLITYFIAIKELIGMPALNQYWVIPVAILFIAASIGFALLWKLLKRKMLKTKLEK